MRRRQYLYVLLPLVIAALSGNAIAGDECEAEYAGTRAPLPAADAQFLTKAIASIKNKKRQELLAISEPKLQFIRRFGFGVDARGGNLWEDLAPQQIDKNLWIHIGKKTLPSYLGEGDVHLDKQTLKDFDPQFFHPKIDGTGVVIGHKACEGARQCDGVPVMNEVEKFVDGLLYCNKYHNAAFVFSDGILLTDMQDVPGAGLPQGAALFFAKTPTGYKLHTLIAFE